MNYDSIRWSGSVFNWFDPISWGLPTADPDTFVRWGIEHRDAFWPTLVRDMSEAGVAGIDLGVAPADWHAAKAWAGSARGFAARLSDAGLSLSSSYQSGHDLTRLPGDGEAIRLYEQDLLRHCAFITDAGADLLVVGAALREENATLSARQALFGILDRFGAAAKRQGVRLAIHTEAYADWTTEAAIDELMAKTDPGSVFLCPDTGHIALAGSDPVAVIDRHWERIAGFHFKDTRSSQPETRLISPEEAEERMLREFCIAGEGIVDWPGIARLMAARTFHGWCAAEVDNAPQPVAATAAIVSALRRAGFAF